MRVGVLKQSDDAEGMDALRMTAVERLAMMWPLAQNAWASHGIQDDPESPNPRHIIRVHRRGRSSDAK